MLLAFGIVDPSPAAAETFEPGSLIIPMDTDYQDMGMLEAYGLVYELLRNDVHVNWVIRADKDYGDPDFTTSAVDLQSNMAIANHAYRGGPFVIDIGYADLAEPIIEAWQTDNPDTAVHEATAMFDGDVSLTLVIAPTIAMVADGNQKIARGYMQAAKIPDSVGDPDWPDASPDMLDLDEPHGPYRHDPHGRRAVRRGRRSRLLPAHVDALGSMTPRITPRSSPRSASICSTRRTSSPSARPSTRSRTASTGCS